MSSAQHLPAGPAEVPAPGLVWLKPGDRSAALYLFAGGGGDVLELAPLAQRLTTARAVASVQLAADGQDKTVEAIADRALALITEAQPEGPFHLLGYSFGGLVAVEVALRLQAAGREVAPLLLVEAAYDHSFWPLGVWAADRMHRVIRRLAELKGAPLGVAIANLRRRSEFLFGLAAARLGGADKGEAVLDTLGDAMALFRPRPYPGPAIFFTAERGSFCHNPPALWRGLIGTLEIERIPGDHLAIVRSQASLERLAAGVDARLGGAPQPMLKREPVR
jgi:acetoacetyl-CoA synthetase